MTAPDNPDYRAVWKYPMHAPVERFEMPADAEVLTVATQHGVPTLWAIGTMNGQVRTREFIGHGTGHPIFEGSLTYVGTAHDVDGHGLVFHIFERAL